MSLTKPIPTCVSTWSFGIIAIKESAQLLLSGSSSIDAVVNGIHTVELDEKDQYYVGLGGLPNYDGIMEFDAAIMDNNKRYGAVMAIQNVNNPIAVARSVMDLCIHNILVGEGALKWALEHNFEFDPNVLTLSAKEEWKEWFKKKEEIKKMGDSHDTIGLICIDKDGHICCGTSTSGWKYKHPGRVGDAPVIGSGLYCDGKYGACCATGDGEEIMRTCLSFLVVELMRQGNNVQEACRIGLERILELETEEDINMYDDINKDEKVPNKSNKKLLTVGIIAMDKNGNVGAASTLCDKNDTRGLDSFPVSCWRAISIDNDTNTFEMFNENQQILLQASVNGILF